MEFDGEVRNIMMLLTRMRTQLVENGEVEKLDHLTGLIYSQYSLAENALVAMREEAQAGAH